jgi:hypothetical protein
VYQPTWHYIPEDMHIPYPIQSGMVCNYTNPLCCGFTKCTFAISMVFHFTVLPATSFGFYVSSVFVYIEQKSVVSAPRDSHLLGACLQRNLK